MSTDKPAQARCPECGSLFPDCGPSYPGRPACRNTFHHHPKPAPALCPQCGHLATGDGKGKCSVAGCGCDYDRPIKRAEPAPAQPVAEGTRGLTEATDYAPAQPVAQDDGEYRLTPLGHRVAAEIQEGSAPIASETAEQFAKDIDEMWKLQLGDAFWESDSRVEWMTERIVAFRDHSQHTTSFPAEQSREDARLFWNEWRTNNATEPAWIYGVAFRDHSLAGMQRKEIESFAEMRVAQDKLAESERERDSLREALANMVGFIDRIVISDINLNFEVQNWRNSAQRLLGGSR